MSYVLLFLPFTLSWLTLDHPVMAYWIAWLGSVLILCVTLAGKVKPLPEGKSFLDQLFRPIVFTHVIFAGYTALSSVFYFVATANQAATDTRASELVSLIARAQCYYVLGHAALVVGILSFMEYRDSGRFFINSRLGANRILFGFSATFLVLSLLGLLFPSLYQLTFRLRSIAMVASVFSFALSLAHREGTHVTINAVVFSINFMLALMGGWKEEILVLMLLFLAAIFPFHKRLASALGVVVIVLFITVMPAYNKTFRQLAWFGNVAPAQAVKLAFQELTSGRVDIRKSTTEFTTERLSEVNLFVKYLERVPSKRPFYGSQIILQTAANLVPRAFWPAKPNTEMVVMERVYENGLFRRGSRISAKPQFVVDSYLWWGIPGIIVGCFIYGALASLISRLCERWFGGYTMGSGVVYAALFQIFWRGNSFEFFFPTVFWSFATMFVLFYLGRNLGIFSQNRILIRAIDRPHHSTPAWRPRPALHRPR
jgi:hypothetical protein